MLMRLLRAAILPTLAPTARSLSAAEAGAAGAPGALLALFAEDEEDAPPPTREATYSLVLSSKISGLAWKLFCSSSRATTRLERRLGT